MAVIGIDETEIVFFADETRLPLTTDFETTVKFLEAEEGMTETSLHSDIH